MSSTDTTTTTASAATTATASSALAGIQSTLSADWQKFVAFVNESEQTLGNFLTDVANGVEIAVEDIIAVGQAVAGKLGVISTAVSAATSVAAAVAPNDTAVQKMLSDVNTAASDIAAVSTSLQSGSTAGDSTGVTTAVNAITAVNSLAQSVGQLGATLSTAVVNSPTATQAVTPSTPGATA